MDLKKRKKTVQNITKAKAESESLFRTKMKMKMSLEQYEKIINNRKLSDSKPKRKQAESLGGSVQREAQSVGRIIVSFTGYRVKPLDPDNFAGSVKDLLDGLRHAGLISGDEPTKIKLVTDQVKVSHYEEEKTVIELEEENE